MISVFATGILLGLAAGLAPGPLLTLVITETLQKNIKAGIKVALAPLVTDLPIIVISVVVLTRLVNSDAILGLISIAGSLFVFYICYETLTTEGVEIGIENSESQSLIKGI